MARDIDVYQLLRSFAHRNSLSEIEYKAFAQTVQRQAKLADQSQNVFRDLAVNPELVLVPRLVLLAKEKKLSLEMAGNEIRTIVLPEHYSDVFLQEYRRMDENPDVPFPDEDSLKTLVPPDWIQSISLESDLGVISDTEGERSVPLYRIVFPDNVRPVVIPSAFVPEKFLEYAVMKLRQYLRKGANKDFMQNKLAYAFPGKENQLKDAISSILTKPFETITELKKSSSDFTFSFWAYFISAIKKDLEKKSDKTSEDWSIKQAALICEFFSNHFKGKAQRLIDLENAFKALDIGLRKDPFHFSLEEIHAFRDGKGVPLLGKYSSEELDAHLRDLCTKAEAGALPELLIVTTGGRRAYIAKEKMLLLAVRHITEARADIRTFLVQKWHKLMEEFRSVPPMDEDEAFERELDDLVESRFPLLASLLRDRLLPLIHEELEAKNEAPPGLDRFFYKDNLAPLDELLELARKDLLADARIMLPFWYTVPIIASIARFMRRRARRRVEGEREKKARRTERVEAGSKEEGSSKPDSARSGANERKAEFTAAASKVARELTPSSYSLEEYLIELEGRWNSLINPESKKNLTEDVNSLVRDYTRGILRSMRGSSFNTERVKNLAATLADRPSLLKIKNHQALELYIQLYMTKILGASVKRE